MSRMREAPRADDADVASLVGRFRAKGEEESRRRDAFDREWDQRVASFRKRCDAVERKLRDRHAAALEKCLDLRRAGEANSLLCFNQPGNRCIGTLKLFVLVQVLNRFGYLDHRLGVPSRSFP